jgi:hypothetical protein
MAEVVIMETLLIQPVGSDTINADKVRYTLGCRLRMRAQSMSEIADQDAFVYSNRMNRYGDEADT